MTRLKTPLCELLGIEHPIIQAGMGWDSRGSTTPPKLVAAVSNAGGLGVIGGSPLQPELIRKRIHATRELTDRPFGVDITLPRLAQTPFADVGNVREFLEQTHPDHVSFVHDVIEEFGLETQGPDPWSKVKTPDMVQRQLDVILEAGVQVLAVGLGDTADVVPMAHERGMKVLALCGNVKQALGHAANGVDVVVAQGYEAGGHTGRIANFPLIPQVVDAVRPTPVVVAGGIADGRGLAAALSLGAVGVWCGTVFLASAESEIHVDYKRQLIQGRTEDFVLDRFPSGKPSRHFRSPVIRKWEASGLQALEMPFQGVLNDQFRVAAESGERVDVMSVPGGQIAGLLSEQDLRPASEIVESMVRQAADVLMLGASLADRG